MRQGITAMIKTMKTFLRTLLFSCSISVALLFVGEPVFSQQQQTEDTSDGPIFLWQVEKEDVPETSYLCGSIHMMKEDFYPLPEPMMHAFAESEYVAVEFDAAAADMDTAAAMLARGTYQDGSTLADHIPEKLYKKLAAMLKELGMPVEVVGQFKPWVAANLISALRLEQAGFSAELGLDMYFLERARERGKEILELESADSQFELFDSMSEQLQTALLRDALNDQEQFAEELDQLAISWKNGDTGSMARLLEIDKERAELNELLLYRRNREMAEKIDRFVTEGKRLFVVVGAGHLVGPKSIVEYLEKRGYACEQIE
jgi:hypothetical protein